MSLRSLIRENIFLLLEKHTHDEVVKSIKRALEICDITNKNNNKTLLDFMEAISIPESGYNSKGIPGGEFDMHYKNPFQLTEDGIWAAQNSAAMEEWRNFIDNKKGLNPSNLSGKIKDQGFDEIKSNINLGALFALLEILFKFDPNSSTGTRDPKKRNTVIFKSIIGDPGSAWKEKYNTSAGAGKKSDFDSKN